MAAIFYVSVCIAANRPQLNNGLGNNQTLKHSQISLGIGLGSFLDMGVIEDFSFCD
jgi:hypothetical protein